MMPAHQYFIRREPEPLADHEESYWVNRIDPDGVVRDFTEEHERTRYLEDVHQEIDFIDGLSPGRVLDIGCGLGFLLSALGEGWEKHGLEISRFAAGYARRWASIHEGPLESAEYPSDWFDLIVMHHVIEHIPDPILTIQEVRRILKASGVLVLATPDFDSGCARRFGANYRLLHDPTHISLFSNESMHRFLRDFGFVIDRVEYPFFETRHFSEENLNRLFGCDEISPPFYGNFMTFYCHKPGGGAAYTPFCHQGSQLLSRAEKTAVIIDAIAKRCVAILENGQALWLYCASQKAWFTEWLRECGVPLVQGAVWTKGGLSGDAAGSKSNKVAMVRELEHRETGFSTGDMILAVCPGRLDPEHVAKVKWLGQQYGLVVQVMTGAEDHTASDEGLESSIQGPADAGCEGAEMMVALSALAARCRELIDGN